MEAIEKIKCPCAILAGAGTGKTYTLVKKIKYLIENNIYSPKKIVCITFSNEAVNSIISTIQKELQGYDKPIIRTFHGFSADLLRNYGEAIGINKQFKILDSNEACVFLARYLSIKPNDCKIFIETITKAKDFGIAFEKIEPIFEKKIKPYENIDLDKKLESLQFQFQTTPKKENRVLESEIEKISSLLKIKKFFLAWRAYEKLKLKRNYQDYSDLNLNALNLLKKSNEIAKNWDYFIIDEFQDTNKIQLELIFELAQKRNITIVGDLNQSIYEFRGAYKDNFSLFKSYFSVSENDIFHLDKSHRSSDRILKSAHNLISNNYSNEGCFETKNAYNHKGKKIEVYELKNEKEEARKIVELIEREISSGIPASEICVMYRNHAQAKIIKSLLNSKKIPFFSAVKGSLLKNQEIKIIKDYLAIIEKISLNKKGGEQIWWDLFYSYSFKNEDLFLLGKFIKENRNSENLGLKIISEINSLALSQEGKTRIKFLLEKIKDFCKISLENVPEMIAKIYAHLSFSQEYLTQEKRESWLNINKFKEIAENHSSLYSPDLSSFLHYLDIMNLLKIEIPCPQLEREGVALMTFHATKGLEYHSVIISNMAQKRFPSEKKEKGILSDDILEELNLPLKHNNLFEERRLCYVAFTRAKENLILTYAKKYSEKEHFPSQFISEAKFNEDALFFEDKEEKFSLPEKDRKFSIPFLSLINAPEFESTLNNLIANKPKNINKLLLSPTALLLFSECQKKYEYKYIFNMPEPIILQWDEMHLGSFVHLILEKGVKKNYKELEDFIGLAKEINLEEKWNSVSLNEAIHLIKVFYERNKQKYDQDSKTECVLETEINGIKFFGKADRIDFSANGIEIIDYKTGSRQISQKHRNWQLGYYAIAAEKLGKVHKLTLDMLKQEKSLEFCLDSQGNALSLNTNKPIFNIYQIKKEFEDETKKLALCYKKGFSACPIEKHCNFCGEYFYNS